MNIFIIEDDIFLSDNLKRTFEKRVICNRIEVSYGYEDFLRHFSYIDSFDIVLLDIHFQWEKKNGLDIIEKIRGKDSKIPIVVMSSHGDVSRISKAFTLWASDYIIKPFRLAELELRVIHWFKNYCYNTFMSHGDILSYKELSYQFSKNTFLYKWIQIVLSKKSKYILFLLLMNANKLVKETELQEKIWGDRDLFKTRNMRVYILRLKKACEKIGLAKHIITVRGEWYMLE